MGDKGIALKRQLKDFLAKAVEALRRLRDELPACRRGHEVPDIDAQPDTADVKARERIGTDQLEAVVTWPCARKRR